MQSAINPQTGEVLFLVNNQWVPPAQQASNPQTGEMAYLVGGAWQIMPGEKPAPQAPAQAVAPPQTPDPGIASLLSRYPAPAPTPTAPTQQLPVDDFDAKFAAQEQKRQEFAPGEEIGKGFVGMGTQGLPMLWEGVGVMKDAGVAATVLERQKLAAKIKAGEINSFDQLNKGDATTSWARSYLGADPTMREKLDARLDKELASRKDFIQASAATIAQYKKEMEKYAPRQDKVLDINWKDPQAVTDFTNWVAHAAGSGAASMVPMMLAALIPGVGPAISFGMGVGMGAGEAAGNRIEAVQKQTQGLPPEQQAAAIADYVAKTNDVNLVVGIISGVLDTTLGPVAHLVKNALKRKAGQEVAAATRGQAMKQSLKTVPGQVLEEGGAGAGQEMAQIGGEFRVGEQKGDVLTKENAKRVFESAAKEAAGGFGGAGANVGIAGLQTPQGAVTPPTPPKPRIEPTFDGTPPPPATPATPAKPPVAPVNTREQKIAEMAARMQTRGLDADEALAVATRQVDEDISTAETKLETAAGELPKYPQLSEDKRVQAIAEEFLDAGVPPAEALAKAIDQAAAEKEANIAGKNSVPRKPKNAPSTGQDTGSTRTPEPVGTTDGTGNGVAVQPPAGAPTEGSGESGATRMVPTGQDAGNLAGGESGTPAAVAVPPAPKPPRVRKPKAAAPAPVAEQPPAPPPAIEPQPVAPVAEQPPAPPVGKRRSKSAQAQVAPEPVQTAPTTQGTKRKSKSASAGVQEQGSSFAVDAIAGLPDEGLQTLIDNQNNIPENIRGPAVAAATTELARRKAQPPQPTGEQTSVAQAPETQQTTQEEQAPAGKKRGRPATIVTEEEKNQNKLERNERNKKVNAASRLLERVKKGFAQREPKYTREDTIWIAAHLEKQHRGSAFGKRVKAYLQEINATPQEIEKVRKMKPPSESGDPFADIGKMKDGVESADSSAIYPAQSSIGGEETSRDVSASINSTNIALNLGKNLYGEPEDMAPITVKELFQNSFDAIKGALEKTGLALGKVHISLNKTDRTITVTDNGLGMPNEVMGNQFLQIGGTVKETDNPSGGFGVAKMLFLLENKQITVTSLRDGVLSKMVTTGKAIADSFETTGKRIQLTATKNADAIAEAVRTLFPDGHGTSITVEIPETYVDSEKNDKRIPFDPYDLTDLPVLQNSPLFKDIEVTLDRGYSASENTLPIGSAFPADKFTPFTTVRFKWGTARIYISKDKVDPGWGSKNTHVLSNGLWQFDMSIKDRPGWDGKPIKRKFYIDVSMNPGMKAQDVDYPFQLNRQGFTQRAQKDFDKIFNYITTIYSQADLASEVTNFGTAQYIGNDGKLTAPKTLEPTAPKSSNAFTVIKPTDKVEIKDGLMTVNGNEVPEITPEDLKNTSIRLDELTIPQSEIETDKVMVHDNTQYPEGDGKAGESLSDRARAKFGQRFDEYLQEIGSIFHDLRDALVAVGGPAYENLAKEAIGVSFDNEYYGVSIKIPFRGMFINPATTSLKGSPLQIAVSILGTMQHELAHFAERSHGASFASEMQRIMTILDTDTTGEVNMTSLKKNFGAFIAENQDIFDYLDKEFRSGNLQPRGNRFQDASYQQIGNEGVAEPDDSSSDTGQERGAGVPKGDETGTSDTGAVSVPPGTLSKTAAPDERTAKEVDTAVAEAEETYRRSKNAKELAKGVSLAQLANDASKLVGVIRRLFTAGTTKQREAISAAITTDYLAELARDDVPELTNTNKLIQSMHGKTARLLEGAANTSDALFNGLKADPDLRTPLEQVVIESTLAEVDPSTDKRNNKLNALYNKLGAKGQKLYNELKTYYSDMSAMYGKLLDDQINELGVSGEAKKNLLTKVRALYESAGKISPYFPLVRKGEYWLRVSNGRDKPDFYMCESIQARDVLAEEIAKERRSSYGEMKADGLFVVGNNIRSLRLSRQDYGTPLTSLFDLVDAMDMADPDARNELKDGIYQLYLMSMPDQSFRKQFINRKGLAGFETDLLQNFSASAVTMSVQLARIQYGAKIQRSIKAAYEAARERPEVTPYIDAMQDRVDLELPKGDRAEGNKVWKATVNLATRAAFVQYLSSAASAILQPLSVFQFGVPLLSARHGFTATMAEMSKMMKVWNAYAVSKKNPIDGSTTWTMPSIRNSDAVQKSQLEKLAMDKMVGRNLGQITLAGELLARKNVPTEKSLSGAANARKNIWWAVSGGMLMHAGERIAQEMVFLTSFRLSRRNALNEFRKIQRYINSSDRAAEVAAYEKRMFDAWVDQAVMDTHESLGNMAPENRPPMMRGTTGKLLTQFNMFPLHATILVAKNFFKMTAPLPQKQRWEATKIFFGTMGTTWILGGLIALPLASTLIGFIGGMWDDKKKDAPADIQDLDFFTWFRKIWLPEQLGTDWARIVERGPTNFLTGLDISSRIGLDNMYFRESNEARNPRAAGEQFIAEHAGPSVTQMLTYLDAYNAFKNGDYRTGVEKMAPAAIRNPLVAERYGEEGAVDTKGNEQLGKDAFTTGRLLWQAIGFRADELGDIQSTNHKVMTQQQRLLNQRNQLQSNLDRVFRKDDVSGQERFLDELIDFNVRHPEAKIDSKQFMESLKARAEARAKSWRGVTLKPEEVGLYGDVLDASHMYADKAETAGAKK